MANTRTNKGTTNKGAKETINTSIIEVVVNGLSAIETIEDIKARIASVEKTTFNIALECAYALGKTIPAYVDLQGNEHGEATCSEPIGTQAKLVEMVGRSKQTISRWIEAMNFILDNNYFSLFANGSLPFSYDKIILICKNKEVFDGYVFADLMAFTVKQLEDFVAKKTKVEESAEETEEVSEKSEEVVEEVAEESAEEEVAEESVEEVTLSYNGKEYTVNKSAFEKWLAENAITK